MTPSGPPRPRRCRALRRVLLGLLLALLPALLVLVPAGPGGAVALEEVPVGSWPLRPEPEVVHLFAPPPTPYAAGHRGVDLAATAGQIVRAALPGTVTFAGSIAGRGVVVVDHGSTRTTYEPVEATAGVGAEVLAGDPVGAVRPGPASHCFPRTCLHWGWIAGETYLDPLLLVGAGPVRLLPLTAPAPVAPAGVSRSPAVPTGVRVGAWPWPRPVTLDQVSTRQTGGRPVRREGAPAGRRGAAARS